MATKKMRFEEALSRLEAVVAELEAGNVSLDESLALYEEGMKLVRFCNGKLDEAEQRVETVALTDEGVVTRPMGVES